MYKHIVTFKFQGTPEIRKEYSEKFRDALLALPEKIEVLKGMEVGINENPAESWDLVLTATVENFDDIAAYSRHPAHVAAAGIIAPVKDSRACVDYKI